MVATEIKTYRVVRFFEQGGRETVASGLTLDEAREHCDNSETSAGTAMGLEARRLTEECGLWFDGYEEEL